LERKRHLIEHERKLNSKSSYRSWKLPEAKRNGSGVWGERSEAAEQGGEN